METTPSSKIVLSTNNTNTQSHNPEEQKLNKQESNTQNAQRFQLIILPEDYLRICSLQ
jgi:hypothetical protein